MSTEEQETISTLYARLDQMRRQAQRRLAEALARLDRGLPRNPGVRLDPRRRHPIMVSPLEPQPEPPTLGALKAELGRRLFFDPILSGDGTRSCATCHIPDLAWGDGRARAATRQHGDMDLRTPTLLNVAWQDGPLGWDGKFHTLESVAPMPMTAPGNMNLPMPEALARLSSDPSYAAAFATAFADPAITRERLEAALSQAGVRYRAESYPAAHGWMMPDFPVYDPVAAARGWDAMLGLFGRTLRGAG